MRKISLKNLNLKEVEQLSREQLKNVAGGNMGSGNGDGFTKWICQTISSGNYDCYESPNGDCLSDCVALFGDDCFGCYSVID